MKYKHYIVTFTTDKTVFTTCMNQEEAEILAMAIMIKNGLIRDIKSIVETNNISDMADTDYIS
jgi:hypothetical protein